MDVPEIKSLLDQLTVNQKLALILSLLLITTGINVGMVNLYASQTDSLETSADIARDQQVRVQEMARFSQQLTSNPEDTTTRTQLNQTVTNYERDLSTLESEETISEFQLRPLPEQLHADIEANRDLWMEYRQQLEVVRTQEPVNGTYDDSVSYIATNEQVINEQLNQIADEYERASGDFSEERESISELRRVNNQIASYTQLIANNEQPGRSDFAVRGSKQALDRRLTRFDTGVTALRSGGTFDGQQLQSPPPGATDGLDELDTEWQRYEASGETVVNRNRYNAEYAGAIQFIQTNTQTLVERSDTVSNSFEAVVDARTMLLQRLLFVLFGMNILVFGAALRFSNRYVGKPLDRLSDVADEIASGEVSTDTELDTVHNPEHSPNDEIEQLTHSFSEMQETLQLVSQQAEALASERFDDPILAESAPGEFGENLRSMKSNLTALIQNQKATQEELEAQKKALQSQKDKLEQQNERLDQFASLVSHDLRNPLGTAQMYLDFARDTGNKEDFDSIEESLNRMDTMIDDLLTFARTGGAVSETERVELSTIARSAWETADPDRAELSLEVEWVEVDADPDKLLHVFENLFRNAAEHGTKEGGDTVTVTVGRIATMPTATRSAPGDKKGFYIADDGVGIAESVRSDIFEHGFSTNERGNGFGMSIVKQVVDAHGWEITVTESEEGGARFEITGV